MIEYNSINTVIHYFCRDTKAIKSFSLWVYEGEVVKAPAKYRSLIGQNIETLADDLKSKGFEHHIIN